MADKRLKIAFVSPLPPLRSGISDYSEELLPYLAEYMDIDIYYFDAKPSSKELEKNHVIKPLSKLGEHYEEYDNVLYHMGNNTKFHDKIFHAINKYPGVVVLHDYSIHGFVATKYIAEKDDMQGYFDLVNSIYGPSGLEDAREFLSGDVSPVWDSEKSIDYSMNELISYPSKGVLVHSKFALERMTERHFVVPTKYAHFPSTDIEYIDKEKINTLRDRYKVSKDDVIIGAFGYIADRKRLDKVLLAIKMLVENNMNNIKFYVVGRAVEGYDINTCIYDYGIADYCTVVSDASMEDFKNYLQLCDVCVNLRYPTAGETSAALYRCLGYGKLSLVTDIGSFAELPDFCCPKVRYDEHEVEDIYKALAKVLQNTDSLEQTSKDIIEYIKQNHTNEITAKDYYDFLMDLEGYKVYDDNPVLYKEFSRRLAKCYITYPFERELLDKATEKIVDLI